MAGPGKAPSRETKELKHSGFDKKGGYPSTGRVISAMPKAPKGPAPGAPTSSTQAKK